MLRLWPPLRVALALGLGFGLAVLARHAQGQHAADQWEFALETGYLHKVGDNSPLDYRIVPTQAVWRSPAFVELWRGASGSRLVLRHRLAILAETFARGPEDYYVGFSGAPSLEHWSADGRTARFLAIGGGAGFVNSKGVAGGQGQDLSFNWFAQLGLRRQLSPRFGVSGGLHFTHHSNLGMMDPNPGIDVVGVSVGLIWRLGGDRCAVC